MSYDELSSSQPMERFLRNLTEGKESVLDVANELTEDGTENRVIRFGSRVLQPEPPTEPDVSRALARNHEFNDIDAFGRYLIREGNETTCVVLADVKQRKIVAVLDEADQTDREMVSMNAIVHPLFQPWGKLLDSAVPVLDFALFAMKHRRAVVEPDGRELAMTFSQVKASKAITMHSGTGKKSINGVVVDLEIAGERSGVAVELPETIQISCPLFVGSEPQLIDIDLLVTEQRDEVVVYMTAPEVESKRIESFEQMVSDLKEQTNLLVGLGSVQERQWNLVE